MLSVGHGSFFQSGDHDRSQAAPCLHVAHHRAGLRPNATAVRSQHLAELLSGARAISDGTTSRSWFREVSLRKRWYT